MSGTSGRCFPWTPPPWETDVKVLRQVWLDIQQALLTIFEDLKIWARARRMSGSDSGGSTAAIEDEYADVPWTGL